MRCPKCKFDDTKVSDTRMSQDGQVIKRRRVCLSCGYKFQTCETVILTYPVVVKRSGGEVEFSRAKVWSSVFKAISKDKQALTDNICDEILNDIAMKYCEKITTNDIGDAVLYALKRFDLPGYMRFASVYKGFKSAEDFNSEIMSFEKTLDHLDEND